MRNKLKHILPYSTRSRLRAMIKFIKYWSRRIRIVLPVVRGQPIRVILGAAETHQQGWYSTNECWLDITNSKHWTKVFHGKQLITHAVAEHVFEHLSYEEALLALRNLSQHMVEGGRIRIAVPDGYHPDKEYLRHVGINGIGDDAADHKQLLNMDILKLLLSQAGFASILQEGFDKEGRLIQMPYLCEDGNIRRSRRNNIKDNSVWDFTDANTSLIVDGIKI